MGGHVKLSRAKRGCCISVYVKHCFEKDAGKWGDSVEISASSWPLGIGGPGRLYR